MLEAIKYVLGLLNNQLTYLLIRPTGLDGTFGTQFGSLFNFANQILLDVAKPIACTILALFFVLEIYRISVRVEGAGGGTGQLGAEVVFKVLFRLALFKVIIDETPKIMQAIYNVTAHLTDRIAAVAFGPSASTNLLDVDAITTSMGGSGIFGFQQQLMLAIPALLIFLVVLFASGIAQVIVYTRFIELYLYYAISPIPLATLPSDELSSVGKNFLKSFAAICLQGTLVFLIMTFFPVIAGDIFTHVSGGSVPIVNAASLSLAYATIVCLSIVLVLALLGSGRLAKSICQAA